MSSLPILIFPDPRLKKVATIIHNIDAKIQRTIDDMFETMYAAKGIGLAATQVNIHHRIVVVDCSCGKNNPLCLINPNIIQYEGNIIHEEGCLSFPGFYAKISRYKIITIEYLDEKNNLKTLNTDKLMSICLQHEIEHLDGITLYNHLSPLKQKLIKNKLKN